MKKLLTIKTYRTAVYSAMALITVGLVIGLNVNFNTTEISSMIATQSPSGDISNIGATIGGGIAAIGTIGAGIGQGYAAGKAAEAVGRNPEAESKIRNTMIIGAAIAETGALYSLVVAIMVIFIA